MLRAYTDEHVTNPKRASSRRLIDMFLSILAPFTIYDTIKSTEGAKDFKLNTYGHSFILSLSSVSHLDIKMNNMII